MGCVFYYVLADGHISSNDISINFDWNIFVNGSCDKILANSLIQQMVKLNPSERPLAKSLIKHPYFWEPERILGLFIDISNRLENRDSVASNVRSHLQNDSSDVIRGNWVDHLESAVITDLHRHRGYNGNQIEDLIRAIRNKV